MLSSSLFALALAGSPGPREFRPLVGTFRYDPVVLVQTGKPVVGAYTIAADRYAYRYFFASEENRRAFLARPELYELQNGGSCGKMGSLSGRGSPDRFAVYDGRIYVFASDGCRATFLANPAKFVERDDPRPKGSDAEARKGRELMAKTLAWAGGAPEWRALKGLHIESRETVQSGGTKYDHRTTSAFEWPRRTLRTDRWNETAYSDLYDGEKGYFVNSAETTPMDLQQIRALQRVRNHQLPSVLKAAAEGKGFVAFARGGFEGGVQRIDTHYDGTWVALEVRPDTGEIVAMEFTGRRQPHGLERHVFQGFGQVGGLKLPDAWTTFFDGKEDGKRMPGQTQYRLDLQGVSFELPK